MIEDILIQYGAIGASMVLFSSFFYKYYTDSKKFQDKITVVIENNTIALTQFSERVQHCPTLKRKV
jgi:hypothetical protein